MFGAVWDNVGYVNTNPRLSYQRRLQQRQTVVFGSMALVLALLMLLGLLWFSGILPIPFNRDFTASEEEQGNVVPCMPEGTLSVENSSITANVYNASNRTGLAGSVAGSLTEQGITISDELNWGGTEPAEPVVIYAAQSALPQAYTVARLFPEAVVLLDGTATTEVLDIVLSSSYTNLLPAEELAALAGGQELTNPENCVVVER